MFLYTCFVFFLFGMKWFAFLFVVVLLCSVVFSVLPARVFVKGFEPEVDCLKLVQGGIAVRNDCGYGFKVVEGEKVVNYLPSESIETGSRLSEGCVHLSNCFLEGGGKRIKVVFKVEERVSEGENFFGFASYSFAGALVVGVFLLFNFLKKKKNNFWVKFLFFSLVLVSVVLFYLSVSSPFA